MKKFLSICVLAAVSTALFAQGGPEPKVSQATKQYRDYRLAETEPSYGLKKVKALVKRIKIDSEDNRRMSDKVYNSLSLPEMFTYNLIHAEDMSQNCNGMPWIVDEEKKIFGYMPGAFGDEAAWSKRQRSFLHSNRSKVISLLRSTIREHHRVGLNLKTAIVELDAYELIPDMVAVFNRTRRDQDIVTVCMLLMKEGKFQPFLQSTTYKKLYGDDGNYQSFITGSAANQNLMISRATAYYKSRMG